MGRREKRKSKRKQRAKPSLVQRTPRVRKRFVAKARPGDAVTVQFAFSGVCVPSGPEDAPESGLREKTEAMEELEAEMSQTLN